MHDHECNEIAYYDLLKFLVMQPSVVGAEEPFFRMLHRELEARGATVTRYLGLLVAEGSKPDSMMLSAHVDRHGLVCTGPNEYQYAAFVAQNRSELPGDTVSEHMARAISERFQDEVVSIYDPWSGSYGGQSAIKDVYYCPRRDNLFFELEEDTPTQPGTPAAYLDQLTIEDGIATAQLDNVVTVAALVHLFELGFQGRVFFTAQEEAGRSWRYLQEWFLRNDTSTRNLLVVDTSPFPTREDAELQDIVLRNKDAGADFHADATALVKAACDKVGARTGFKDEYIAQLNVAREQAGENPRSIGRTELGYLIAASENAISGTTIQIPTTEYHTQNESASVESISAFLQTLVQLMHDTDAFSPPSD